MNDFAKFVWEKPTGLDQALAYFGHRIAIAISRSTKKPTCISLGDFQKLEARTSSSVCVVLPRSEAFLDPFPTRSASYGNLKKILKNELCRLSPTEREETIILSKHENTVINLLHIRKNTLVEIEEKSKALGIAELSIRAIDGEDLSFLTPAPLAQERRERRLTSLAWILMVAGTWTLLTTVGSKQATHLDQLKRRDAYLRSALLERADAERETGALGELATRQPESLTASARLQQLSELTAATPKSAWWTRITFDGQRPLIEGVSPNAADTLSEMSSKLKDKKIRFNKNISDSTAGQNFSFTVEGKPNRE